MNFTKGQLTNFALLNLKARNIDAWRNNQFHLPRRTFTGRLGVPDLIGFHKLTGLFAGIEIKTKNDVFSDEQREFLTNLKRAGGIALICTEENSEPILKEFV